VRQHHGKRDQQRKGNQVHDLSQLLSTDEAIYATENPRSERKRATLAQNKY
jgi:hypothetical protein